MLEPCYIYLRVSGEDQVHGHGFSRQREACYAHASRAGLDIVQEYQERVTGTSDMSGRHVMFTMLANARDAKIKVVLVGAADRFARDSLAAELLVREFTAAKVKVIAADTGADLTADDRGEHYMRTFCRKLFALLAEMEKETLVYRMRVARDAKRKLTGRCEGRRAFGAASTSGRIQPPAHELETIARAIALLKLRNESGRRLYSVMGIARILNQEKRPSAEGKDWTRETITRLIKRSVSRRRWRTYMKDGPQWNRFAAAEAAALNGSSPSAAAVPAEAPAPSAAPAAP